MLIHIDVNHVSEVAVVGVRAQQKEQTKQAIIQAAFNQLSPEQSFSQLSLREVTREAGIAPTSFYHHFESMEALGLTLVDQVSHTLNKLMIQAREQVQSQDKGVLVTSTDVFMQFVESSKAQFRLLLRERTGTSLKFRQAIAQEVERFTRALAAYLIQETSCSQEQAYIQADAMVTLTFNAGAQSLDMTQEQKRELMERLVCQLKFLAKGA